LEIVLKKLPSNTTNKKDLFCLLIRYNKPALAIITIMTKDQSISRLNHLEYHNQITEEVRFHTIYPSCITFYRQKNQNSEISVSIKLIYPKVEPTIKIMRIKTLELTNNDFTPKTYQKNW
jgi:hypothetical protein